MRRIALAAFLALLAPNAFARHHDDDLHLPVSVSDELVVRAWQPQRFDDVLDRLVITGSVRSLTMGARIEGVTAWPRDRAGLFEPGTPRTLASGTLVPERLFLRVMQDGHRLDLGDFYKTFGHGIALSLSKIDEIDSDTSITGGNAVVALGDAQATFFGGRSNPRTISFREQNRITRDVHDQIVGGGFSADADAITAGVHAVDFQLDHAAKNVTSIAGSDVDLDHADIAGATLGATGLFGNLDASLEGDVIRYSGADPLSGDEAIKDGHALFGSATFTHGWFNLTVDAKSYVEMEAINVRAHDASAPYRYSIRPSLEDDAPFTADIARSIDSRDIHGGRVRASWLLPGPGRTPLRLLLSGQFEQDLGNEKNIEQAAGHLTMSWGSHSFEMASGVRVEPHLHTSDRDSLVFGSFKVTRPFTVHRYRSWGTIEAKVAAYREHAPSRVDEAVTSLTYRTPVNIASLAAIWAHTNDPLAAANGNLARNDFGALALEVNPTELSVIRLFVGGEKGAETCAEGACRALPPFKGIRLEARIAY